MDENEAIVSAYRFWNDNTSHNRGVDLYEEPPLQPYDADQALHTLEQTTKDDPFWKTVDRIGLKTRFITYIDYRLLPKGKNYAGVMEGRRRMLVADTA
jgi:hypothetical protein